MRMAPSMADRGAAASLRGVAEPEPWAHLVRALEEDWRRGGAPTVERYWADSHLHETPESLLALAALVKADLRCRYARGESPAIAEYLKRFPELKALHDRVVSLIYEEFCLREEHGERLDPDQFCDRYQPWRDSLASQLRYHRLLSQVVAPASAPTRFPEIGERFQGYHLRAELGRGGVARVYLAHEEAVGDREVALKVSRDRGKEPSIQGRLDHAHIMPVLSVTPPDPETGLHGLCMPYRPGLPLNEVIERLAPASRPRRAWALWDAIIPRVMAERKERPSTPGWQGFPLKGSYAEGVAWVVAVVARALEHAHAHGVLHRDVKPANILLTIRDGPQLLDFNLAHAPHAADRAEAALRGGTLPYMAPEQLEAFLDPQHWDDVGEGADLYALGLLFRELLTGQQPEPPDPSLPLPRAIRDLLDHRLVAPPSLRASNPTIPHALDAIVARCLAYRPADRYPNARALVEDLERFLAHQPLRHAKNPSQREAASNWVRRNRLRLVVGPGAVAALVFGMLAVQQLQQIVQHHQTKEAIQALQQNRNQDAARKFRRLARWFPRAAFPHFGLAIAFERGGDHVAADREFARGLTLGPSGEEWKAILQTDENSAIAHVYLGLACERAKLPDAAEIQYDRAENLNDAEAAFRRGVVLNPDSVMILTALGKVRSERSQWDAARQAFSAALARDPHYYRAYEGLARVEKRGFQRYDAAIAEMAKAISLARSRKARETILGRYYQEQAAYSLSWGEAIQEGHPERLAEARKHFLDALDELKPTEPMLKQLGADVTVDIHYVRARAELRLGEVAATLHDGARAVEHFQKAERAIQVAIELEPGHNRSKELKAKIDEKLADPALASERTGPVETVHRSK
jgi:serine/threonine protein kinase